MKRLKTCYQPLPLLAKVTTVTFTIVGRKKTSSIPATIWLLL